MKIKHNNKTIQYHFKSTKEIYEIIDTLKDIFEMVGLQVKFKVGSNHDYTERIIYLFNCNDLLLTDMTIKDTINLQF